MTDRLYRLKSNDYSLDYWRGALEGAFKECEQIERALGLPPDVHTTIAEAEANDARAELETRVSRDGQ